MFRTRLKELIELSGKSAKSISDNTNISQSAISYYLNNKREPTLNVLIELANYFQCSIDYLVGNENDYGLIEINNVLSPTEERIISIYRKSNKTMQKFIESYIDNVDQLQKDKEHKNA